MVSKKKGAAQARGYRYEKKKAKDHGKRHIGGPGKPDAPGMEVKNWKNPISRPTLIKARRKGIVRFVNKGGFTGPAVKYGKEVRMKLYQGKKKVS